MIGTDIRIPNWSGPMLRLVVSDLDRGYCLSGIIGKTIIDEFRIRAIAVR